MNDDSSKLTDSRRADLMKLAIELGGPHDWVTQDELVVAAKLRGMFVTWQDIYSLANHSRLRATGSFVIPPFVTDFLGAYAKEIRAQNILDPFAGVGSLLLPIMDNANISQAVGIVPNTQEIKLAKAMASRPVEWLNEDPALALQTLGQFDLVVSSPPWGVTAKTERLETPTGPIEVRDAESFITALKAAMHISDGGYAVLIVPNNFFVSAQSASVRNVLPRLGLYIDAIVTLSADAFSPFTTIETNLVFVSRKEVAEVFVGRLSPAQNPATLLDNLKERKPGAAPELGRLVPLQEYRGWHALVAGEEEKRLAERSGLTAVPLSSLVTAVNLANRQKEDAEAFNDFPNSVYLPLIGTSPAVTALSDLRIKSHNYAQLVVNADQAYAGFLAEFFNSDLGRKSRDKLLTGAFIPKINKQSILSAIVYTLPLNAQKKAVDVSGEIRQLRLALEQLQTQLWRRPVDAADVQKRLATLNEKDSFEAWVETMPFPLASILWRYRASADVRSKNEHLLHFFEATTLFLATLMTSAFHSDAQFFEKHKREWFKKGDDSQYSLAKSNFGQWVHRCYSLAKTTRTLLNSKDTRDLCLSLYRTYDAAKLTTIADRALYSTLEKAGSYRNLQAHGGITSEENELRRLTLLEMELTEIQSLLGTVFESWWLVRPGANRYTKGVYHYTAEKLTGSRQVFTQEKVQTTSAMDSDELYLFDTVSLQPLQLLHFFRMMPSPRTEEIACYFYNRVEKDGVRWVSYHFEKDADVVSPDPSVIDLIREVEQNGDE